MTSALPCRRTGEQLVAEAQRTLGLGEHHHAAAALGLGVEVGDDVGAQVSKRRSIVVGNSEIVEGAHGARELAAVVGGHLEAAEAARHLLRDGLDADVVDEHVHHVTDGLGAVVAAPHGAQGAVDGFADLVAFVDVAVGLGERRVAGVADDAEVFVALLLRDRQVTGGDRERVELAYVEVAGGAAAVPVVELDELDAQLLHHGARGDVVGLAGGFGRTAGIVEVSHWTFAS